MRHKKELHVVYIITAPACDDTQTISNTVASHGIRTHLVSGIDGTLISHPQALLQQSSNQLRAFWPLLKTLRSLKLQYPDIIVHTQSGHADLAGRWAAWITGINPRIHTIHKYQFHESKHILHRFVLYILECITSIITTHYICLSSDDVKTGIKLFPRFHDKHSIIFQASTRLPAYNTHYYAAHVDPADAYDRTVIDEHVQLYRTLSIAPIQSRRLN